jgi:hypothetical protein
MSNGLMQEDPLRRLLEKDAVVSTINHLFSSTDEMDWESVRRCFAPAVWVDMTSVVGGEPEDTTGEAIASGWSESLGHLKAIHHQAGNYEVQVHGNEAAASCYGIASHFLPNDSGENTRTLVGTYDLRLRKLSGTWRIDRFRFNLKYVAGNPDLEGAGTAD